MDPLDTMLQLGLRAGGLAWILSGLAIFLPLYFELAAPFWGRQGCLRTFSIRCLLVLACATLPFGMFLGAAAVYDARRQAGTLPELCEAAAAVDELIGEDLSPASVVDTSA